MNLSLKVAWRYIFGKKSTNVINVISAISVLGLAVGTAALILVLSVFNGLSLLISGMFGAFNPDLLILPAQGKQIDLDSTLVQKLQSVGGVIAISATLEELALFENEGVQAFGKIKGVDSQYDQVSRIGGYLYTGDLKFMDGDVPLAVLGIGIADRLGVNVYDPFASILAYAPKRERRGALDKPFKSMMLKPGGLFLIQQEFDNEYILCDLDFAQELLELPGQVSSYELRLQPEGSKQAIQEITQILGTAYTVKDRFQQDEAFLKIQNLEKWIGYVILTLTLILVSFNLVGAIWMILREKVLDISIFRAMGLTNRQIGRIFLYMGFLLGSLGAGVGVVIALFIYWLQINYGLVTIPDGFAVSTYPVDLSWWDVIVVAFTVLMIGLLAGVPAARKASGIRYQNWGEA
jgi:lipoprotein-releasing system permease protein